MAIIDNLGGMGASAKEQLQAIYDVTVGSIYSYENPKYHWEHLKNYHRDTNAYCGTQLYMTIPTENLSTLYVGRFLKSAGQSTNHIMRLYVYDESENEITCLSAAYGKELTEQTVDISGNNSITLYLDSEGWGGPDTVEIYNMRIY